MRPPWSRCCSQHAEINKRREKTKKPKVFQRFCTNLGGGDCLRQGGADEGAGLIKMLPDTKVFPADYSLQTLGLRLLLGLKCVSATGGGVCESTSPQEADHLLALLFICLHGCRRRRWRNLNEPGGGGVGVGGRREHTFLLSEP